MNEKELLSTLIDAYINLQRIQNADDKEKELDKQIRVIKTKLESFGVLLSDIKIN